MKKENLKYENMIHTGKSVFDVFFFLVFKYVLQIIWCRGVVVITTAQLHSTKLEIRFCVGLNPACGVSEIRDAEDLWQWSWLKIRLNVFRRSTMPQKQFIIIIIIIIIISNSPIVCRKFQPPLPPIWLPPIFARKSWSPLLWFFKNPNL